MLCGPVLYISVQSNAAAGPFHICPAPIPAAFSALMISSLVQCSPTVEHCSFTTVHCTPTVAYFSFKRVHCSHTVVQYSPTITQCSPTIAQCSHTIAQCSPTIAQCSPTVEQSSCLVVHGTVIEDKCSIRVLDCTGVNHSIITRSSP